MSTRLKLWTTLAFAAAAACATITPASASTETVLHTMCSSASCADGEIPQSQLIKSGNILYGVAAGGSHGGGVVFQYDLSTSTYTVIYNFCSTHVAGHPTVCSDGESPTGRLVIDTSGNLYGTTSLGGNVNDAGMVYKLTKSGGTWSLSSLYKFCPSKIGSVECDDGDDPLSGLTYAGQASGTAYDGTSTLYGSTYVGGLDSTGSYGNGVIFDLTLSGGTWSENVIHTFCVGCAELCYSCSDGEWPIGQMIIDSSGAIFGSTEVGGGGGQGTVFKLAPSTFAETVLYTFCSTHASPCTDGGQPTGVLLDAAGDIFGTAQVGGTGGSGTGAGVLFELTNSGGTWSESVKYDFCGVASCADGSAPRGDLIMDGSGNILGTTATGGSHAIVSGGAGTIWKYDGTSESALYKFCPTSSICADGQDPGAGVMIDTSGNLYGDTIMGGTGASAPAGVVYKFVP